MSSNMERVAAMPDASLYVNRDGRRADDCVDSHGGGNLTKIPRSGGDSQNSNKLVLFEILVEVSLLSPWRSPCRRGTRVIISTPLIPVHVTFAHRVTTCTGSTDKERRLSRSTRNP